MSVEEEGQQDVRNQAEQVWSAGPAPFHQLPGWRRCRPQAAAAATRHRATVRGGTLLRRCRLAKAAAVRPHAEMQSQRSAEESPAAPRPRNSLKLSLLRRGRQLPAIDRAARVGPFAAAVQSLRVRGGRGTRAQRKCQRGPAAERRMGPGPTPVRPTHSQGRGSWRRARIRRLRAGQATGQTTGQTGRMRVDCGVVAQGAQDQPAAGAQLGRRRRPRHGRRSQQPPLWKCVVLQEPLASIHLHDTYPFRGFRFFSLLSTLESQRSRADLQQKFQNLVLRKTVTESSFLFNAIRCKKTEFHDSVVKRQSYAQQHYIQGHCTGKEDTHAKK